MSTDADTIGVARDHRWMRAGEQERRLRECCRIVAVLGDRKGREGKGRTMEDLVRLTRPGTVIKLMYPFLLADPTKKRLRGGILAEFNRSLAAIEKRGGVLRDVLTGLSTETKEKRAALLLSVKDQIRRSSQGRSSEDNGSRSRGRPQQWGDAADRQIVWEEWHSNLHQTNGAAAAAASKRLGRKINAHRMWVIVKEEREKRGIEGKGASGRRPNVKALLVAQGVKRAKGCVYFLKNGRRKQVKIGFGVCLNSRIDTLRAGSPEELRVLGSIPGDRATEGALHKRFAQYRIRREWFRLEGELAEYVAGLPKPKRT